MVFVLSLRLIEFGFVRLLLDGLIVRLVVRMQKGVVRQVNPVVVSMGVLESGIKVYWHDRVVNGLIRRIPLDVSVEA